MKRKIRTINFNKTGSIQKPFFAILLFFWTLLFSFGCKPQRVVSQRVVSQTDSSAVLQLKDSLYFKEIKIAILESDLKHMRTENINLRSETARYEVNYDTNTAVDSITSRPAVISEVLAVNKKFYEESYREYEILLQEASIENKNLSLKYSNLKLVKESLENENLELISKCTSKTGFKNKIIIAVLIFVMLIVLKRIIQTLFPKTQ